MNEAESPQIAAARELATQLDKARWDGGVRIVLQGSMQAIAKKGSMDLKARWRADVFYGRGRKPAFVMVADTPAAALRDVAALL